MKIFYCFYRISFIVLLLLACSSCGRAQSTDTHEMVGGNYPDLTYAAEKTVNAVVHVMVESRQQVNPWMQMIFGGRLSAPLQQSSGSGVILAENGYIVTNCHVIASATQIKVVLNDKREFTANLVGADPATDIALLKIDATDLPFLTMGNSDDLRIGEWVLAVGNPFNLTSTVTAGIVSAKARKLSAYNSDMKLESFIQTDAAVNPGNSGGALVNVKGELIGINTAIQSQTGNYIGYSFAVPSSIVEKVVADLRAFGHVQRAVLGIQMQDITTEIKERYELATQQGAFVYAVAPTGAAAKANIVAWDVIIAIDGKAISTTTELLEQIALHRPGDTVVLTILRGKNQLKAMVVLTDKDGFTN